MNEVNLHYNTAIMLQRSVSLLPLPHLKMSNQKPDSAIFVG